jgi:hypothetical protein
MCGANTLTNESNGDNVVNVHYEVVLSSLVEEAVDHTCVDPHSLRGQLHRPRVTQKRGHNAPTA